MRVFVFHASLERDCAGADRAGISVDRRDGVDLVQGDFLTSFAEGSIGSGDAALELTRMLGNAGTNGTSGTSQWDHMLLNAVSLETYVDFGPQVSRSPASQAMGQTLTGSGSSYRTVQARGASRSRSCRGW